MPEWQKATAHIRSGICQTPASSSSVPPGNMYGCLVAFNVQQQQDQTARTQRLGMF